MPNFQLPNHVYVCLQGDSYVFLDLMKDEYTLVNGAAAAALKLMEATRSDELGNCETSKQLEILVKEGLLLAKETGRVFREIRSMPVLDRLTSINSMRSLPRTSFKHFSSFLLACSVAAAKLRMQHISNVVANVRIRKLKSRSNFDADAATDLTSIFLGLRSFFPRDYICLFDSLALLEFLALYDQFPDWVFGVKLEPWGAHCWVQSGTHALNEDVEEASRYKPILVI